MDCRGDFIMILAVFAYTLFSGILLLTSMYALIMFIRDHKNQTLSKMLFITGIIFCIITSIHLIISTIFYPFVLCDKGDTIRSRIKLLGSIYLLTYFVHINLFYLILFMKLYFVFRGSAYEMQKSCVRCWIVLFIISPFLYISFIYFIALGTLISAIDILVTWIWGVMIPLCLAMSFIYKLLKVYQSIEKDSSINENVADDKILSAITKNAILTMISIPFTVIVIPVFLSVRSLETMYGMSWVILLDVYTNLICSIFSYELFSKSYLKICGCLDLKCRQCCHRMANSTKQNDKYQPLKNYQAKHGFAAVQ
eukprot:210522_1